MAAVVDGMTSNTSIHYPYLMEVETTFSIDPVCCCNAFYIHRILL